MKIPIFPQITNGRLLFRGNDRSLFSGSTSERKKKNGLTFCSPQSPFKVQNHLVWVFCGLEAPDESPQSSVVVVVVAVFFSLSRLNWLESRHLDQIPAAASQSETTTESQSLTLVFCQHGRSFHSRNTDIVHLLLLAGKLCLFFVFFNSRWMCRQVTGIRVAMSTLYL